MKKRFFAIIATLLLLSVYSCKTDKATKTTKPAPDMHTAEIMFDWNGIYAGVIPAADGEGINVKITLNNDKTYAVEYQYIGKSEDIFNNKGTFHWDSAGSSIILDNAKEGSFPQYYKVGENKLIQLDMEGNIITGELADNYILKKQ
jgi:uncharacterized lipoprotein NlpE involved in copper resistance